VVQSPTVTVTTPPGSLCEGHVYTFTATALPNINPENYTYQWSNGVRGSTMSTGKPGTYSVTVTNPSGCTASTMAGIIKKRPDISLFPLGCDTLCLTDTLRFPLPMPAPAAYSITWYDDDGTAITSVGNTAILILATLQPGSHHLYAIVSFPGGCADTTGKFDLYIKDCTLTPPCNNCPGLLGSTSAETETSITAAGNYQLNNSSVTFTILKPVKEVRISLADLKYYWKDTACNNCKLQMLERGCLFPTVAGKNLGTLLWNDYTASDIPPATATNKCPDEIVWKNGTALLPGTYTIPLLLTLPKPTKDKCQLVLDKLCFHLTIIDTSCNTCDTRICKKDGGGTDDCKCNAANTWTSLYLLPQKPGIPKPRNLIFCNSTITDIVNNTAYVLSGVFHCQGKCASTKNEVTVYNQVNQVIYTHVSAALNETIVFPTPGMYSISLAATCGTKKCTCSFRIYVTDGKCADCPTGGGKGTGGGGGGGGTGSGGGGGNTLPGKIDSVLHQILPPDFNGGILVSKNDSILYEKYVSYKDSVNSHTAFDLASVTKTFTAMAILKLMEEGKLNVDDAVSKYLPEFPIPEITIKMLLSHKSGLEDYLKFMDESDWDKTRNLTNNDLLQFIAANRSKVLINTPGKVFDYSNTNFALLSLIIEKVSGQLYKDYLSATFFKPLQMNDTYVLGPDNFAKATRSYYKNGKLYSLRYLDLVTGDKCVYSTVQDLKKWDKGLRNGKLFKRSTLDMAYAPTSPLTPFASNYGLGWKKIVTANGNEMIYHTGWWAGSRSLLIRLPKENTMIAVLSNNNFTNINDIRKLCDLFGDYQQSDKKIANF
jgi:CubicO group peptidase (beta-lactamase class C family)